ncbi:hypothetical protein FIA58_019250 [Flavobacterium jejuense]|uniref:Uncharacterized protein n=1 Tax=Flavobacterium jejuense TaxID=1544455 RepID=A0ABX0IX65_9FLAO|nr:hypothetical protein [Flavobacterium jejuense]
MTRKDFITIALTKKIKPLVYIIFLLYAITFLIQALSNKNSIERFLLIFIIISIALCLFLGMIYQLIIYFNSKLSEKVKSFFKIVSTITEVISGILLVSLVINSWKENNRIYINDRYITIYILYQKI